MIDRFLCSCNHVTRIGGKIKGRCQPPLVLGYEVASVKFWLTPSPLRSHKAKNFPMRNSPVINRMQEPTTRSVQLPDIRVTAFSHTYLFLD